MTIEIITLVLSLTAIVLCTITAVFSFLAYSTVVGLRNSTHQIQWMPVEQPQKLGDNEPKNKFAEEFGDIMYPDIEEEQV